MDTGHPHRYRSRSGDRVVLVSGALMIIALAVFSIALQHVAAAVPCVIAIGLVVAWLVRWLRAGLYLVPDGVELRRFFRAPLMLRWSEIAGFSAGLQKQSRWVGAPEYRALFVELVDGRRFKVDGTGETLFDPDLPDRAALALEAERQRLSALSETER